MTVRFILQRALKIIWQFSLAARLLLSEKYVAVKLNTIQHWRTQVWVMGV